MSDIYDEGKQYFDKRNGYYRITLSSYFNIFNKYKNIVVYLLI